jgi:hypothetical protein
MDADQARLLKMQDEWSALDEAIITSGQCIDPDCQWPWLSSHPHVKAAWEALTRPEILEDLEFWLAHFDDGASMNEWAAKTTRKAI